MHATVSCGLNDRSGVQRVFIYEKTPKGLNEGTNPRYPKSALLQGQGW